MTPGKAGDRAARRQHVADAISVLVALLDEEAASPDQHPLRDWKEFSGEGFNAVAVRTALQQAGDELAQRAAAAPGRSAETASHAPALDATLMHALPEGLRRWFTLRSGESSVTGVTANRLVRSDADGERIAADALALLDWINAEAAASGASDAELAAWASDDGKSWQALPEPLRWGVALFAASLGHAAAGAVPAIPAGFPRRDEVAVTAIRREASVALATVRRLAEWAQCVETLCTSAPPRDMSLRFALLERHLRAPGQCDGQSNELTVTTSSGGRELSRLRLPLDRAALPHLFLGTIGETPNLRLERRTASLDISIGNADAGDGDSGALASVAIFPHPIPQQGSPRSIVAYGAEGGCVCLRFHSTESILVAKDGTVRPHHRWPRGIIGELPFGTSGAVAWGNGRSVPDQITPGYVMYRRQAAEAAVVEELPFRPVLGSWCGDRIFWSCLPSGADGWTGVASWAPGETPRRELAAITTFDIHARADGSLILEPCARRADDSIERRLATMAWRWQPGVAMQPFPLGPMGASSHRAESRGWTAVAYPHADAVRLSSVSGRVFTMQCPSPFRLAWVDGDLMISTLSLELWRFPQTIEQLERLAGISSASIR